MLMGLQPVPQSMATYKGNVGNLMQHWTLCELLAIAGKHAPELNFVDAHAMAPYARKRKDADKRFDRVLAGLPGRKSVYEKAWKRILARQRKEGYPNSAAFVKEVWEGSFSLLLCEIDPPTIAELKPWLRRVQKSPECENSKLFQGDWRKRFDEGLPSASEVGLRDGSLTLVSFDPNMYDRHGPPQRRKPENMYPPDLSAIVDAIRDLRGGVIIQLSTYSANNGNAQKDVLSSVDSILTEGEFALAAVVWANGNMMSLVYARDVSWSAELADLPGRFRQWLPRI